MTIEEIVAVKPRNTDYLFFMTPDTGAGCGIVVDEISRGFVELVDSERTVAEIGKEMGQTLGEDAAKLVPRIYESLKVAGLFDRPRFLTEFEDGTISWRSCFPEVYRAYH